MVILSDVDDVLLNYTDGFAKYHGLTVVDINGKNIEQIYNTGDITWELIDEFNNSDSFKYLEPLSRSQTAIKQLSNDGYAIHAITACGDNDKIIRSRIENLKNVFGDVFIDISFVSYHESKFKHLVQYKDSGKWWIEDNIDNYHLGLSLGLKSALLHPHKDPPVDHHYNNWDDIYKNIRSL